MQSGSAARTVGPAAGAASKSLACTAGMTLEIPKEWAVGYGALVVRPLGRLLTGIWPGDELQEKSRLDWHSIGNV